MYKIDNHRFSLEPKLLTFEGVADTYTEIFLPQFKNLNKNIYQTLIS